MIYPKTFGHSPTGRGKILDMAKKKAKSNNKMKSYDSIKDWIADQTPAHQVLVKALRKVIASASPKLIETVKWGNGCWELDELPITYIYSDINQVHIGFFAGSMVKDPKKRFEGNGKYVRYIKIYDKKDIDAAYFTKLIKAAMKIKYR